MQLDARQVVAQPFVSLPEARFTGDPVGKPEMQQSEPGTVELVADGVAVLLEHAVLGGPEGGVVPRVVPVPFRNRTAGRLLAHQVLHNGVEPLPVLPRRLQPVQERQG